MKLRTLIKGGTGARKAGTAEERKPKKRREKNCNGRVERRPTKRERRRRRRREAESNSRCIEMHYLIALEPPSSCAQSRQDAVFSSSGGKSKAQLWRVEGRNRAGRRLQEKRGALANRVVEAPLCFSIVFLSLSLSRLRTLSLSLSLPLFLSTQQLTGTCRYSSSPPRRWRRWTACFRR